VLDEIPEQQQDRRDRKNQNREPTREGVHLPHERRRELFDARQQAAFRGRR
jgi:hypothetical protein